MSRIRVAAKNDLQLLGLLRDELKLQTHLLGADVKKRWEQLEADWSQLQERVGRAEVAGQDAGRDAQAAVKTLVETLRKGYESIRKALESKAARA